MRTIIPLLGAVIFCSTAVYCNTAREQRHSRCPAPDSFGRACFQYYDQCTSNSDCDKGNSCCLVAGCGKECMATRKPKPLRLRCPVSFPVMCVWFNEQCKGDQDCASGEWCCGHSCGTSCSKPEPRGACPDLGDVWSSCSFGQNLCTSDADCDRNSCCPYGPNGSCGGICI